MSNSFETTSPSGSDVQSPHDSGKADAAKHEAADLADTATTQAKDVLGTAKDEAASVVGEAKTQVKDLYAQTTRELKEQANTQQQRLAGGLRSVSDELGSMASNSEGSGVASDLVQQVAGRLSGAASWLGDRDPASVVTEVKRFARRKPGVFILGAAITGVVVGRLTRALASNHSSDEGTASAGSGSPSVAPPVSPPVEVHPDPAVPVPVGSSTTVGGATGAAQTGAVPPTYQGGAQTTWTGSGALGEGSDERPHSV